MYTPNQIREDITLEYVPPTHLKNKYDILIKYNLLPTLDMMVWGTGMELSSFLNLFTHISEESKENEFFDGMALTDMDMLDGDISELAPILYDRIELRLKYTNGLTVKEIIDGFTMSKELRNNLYDSYFEKG